jgi:hypothetical protein
MNSLRIQHQGCYFPYGDPVHTWVVRSGLITHQWFPDLTVLDRIRSFP